jgi:hypothetical protein
VDGEEEEASVQCDNVCFVGRKTKKTETKIESSFGLSGPGRFSAAAALAVGSNFYSPLSPSLFSLLLLTVLFFLLLFLFFSSSLLSE